jgi:hypothetical protein
VWLASFVHAAVRPAQPATQPTRRAWREQCAAIAVLAVTAVVLNGITTGDHLFQTLAQGYWPVAGMDLMLLAAAALATACWRRLGRIASAPKAMRGEAAPRTAQPGSEGAQGA